MALRPAPASAIGWPRTDRASHIESVSGGWFRVSSAARRMGAANAIYRTKLIRMMAQRYGDATKLGKTKHLFPSFFSLWLFLFIYFFLSFPFSIFSFFSYRLLRLKKKKEGEKKNGSGTNYPTENKAGKIWERKPVMIELPTSPFNKLLLLLLLLLGSLNTITSVI